MNENYRGYDIVIEYDECSESPREWDNLGTMVCFHRRYSLGDKHNFSIDEVKEIAENSEYISLPLYLYDHSGITMNTSGFSCPWDSGQVGIIFVSKEQIRKEYGWKKITAKRYKQICEYLKSEVDVYDMFLRGEVYYYSVEDDSCGGYYGYEDCLAEAKGVIDYYIDKKKKAHFARLKSWIRNKVPVIYREPYAVM